jgi:hypothetical protein
MTGALGSLLNPRRGPFKWFRALSKPVSVGRFERTLNPPRLILEAAVPLNKARPCTCVSHVLPSYRAPAARRTAPGAPQALAGFRR